MIAQFYMTPGSCSTGIHILLEELELPFEVYLVDLIKGDQLKESYLQLNPRATIPMFIPAGGEPLTDYLSISWWLARQHPMYKLLPDGIENEVKALEIMNFAVSEIHGRGFTRIFTPEKYLNEEEQIVNQLKQQGMDIVVNGFRLIEQMIDKVSATSGEGLIFENLSVADTALFYVEFWADRTGIALPLRCEKHYQVMLERPVVRQVLSEEGYGNLFYQ
ncbi:MAG: glutathione S-transferase N-terminal domain-containing protein [Neptuniibacter sp.]